MEGRDTQGAAVTSAVAETVMELKLLTREQIIQKDDLIRERVDVPEWGGFVYVREMTGTEREQFRKQTDSNGGKDSPPDSVEQTVARCTCDASGKLIFTEADVAMLREKSQTALARVFGTAIRLSKLSKQTLDQSLGNSREGQSSDSTTA